MPALTLVLLVQHAYCAIVDTYILKQLPTLYFILFCGKWFLYCLASGIFRDMHVSYSYLYPRPSTDQEHTQLSIRCSIMIFKNILIANI